MRCFSSPGSLPEPMDSVRDTLAGGFPHSEISGSMLVCQLPGAFRRLPRLSSPVVAKASTACAWSLDPPTPTHAGSRVASRRVVTLPRAPSSRSRALLRCIALSTFLKNGTSVGTGRQGPARYRRRADTTTHPTTPRVVAPRRLSRGRISSGIGSKRVKWWSQAGSNRRPPACKAGALPAELWPHIWWVWVDSNHRPHPYQGCALTD